MCHVLGTNFGHSGDMQQVLFLIHLLDVGFGTTICPGSKRLVITVYFDGEVHPQTWGWIADKNG